VKALFDSLSNNHNVDSMQHRAVEVFLDTNRLEDGKHFQKSFISSLINSYVITPIISKDALLRIVNHAPDTVDNLLIEWITALECLHINSNNNDKKVRLARIYPILFGSVSDDGRTIGDLFKDKDGIMNKIPAIIPTMCIDKVVELMNENGLQPRADITQRTVKSFIDELMSFLGFKAWEVKNDESAVEVCSIKIVDVIQQVIVTIPHGQADSIKMIQQQVIVLEFYRGVYYQ
jgi:hypothetical protein